MAAGQLARPASCVVPSRWNQNTRVAARSHGSFTWLIRTRYVNVFAVYLGLKRKENARTDSVHTQFSSCTTADGILRVHFLVQHLGTAGLTWDGRSWFQPTPLLAQRCYRWIKPGLGRRQAEATALGESPPMRWKVGAVFP